MEEVDLLAFKRMLGAAANAAHLACRPATKTTDAKMARDIIL